MKLIDVIPQEFSDIAERYVLASKGIYEYLGIDVLHDIEYNLVEKTLSFSFYAHEKFQGHPGLVHGGIISTLSDTGMGILGMILSLFEHKVVFTAEMTTTYLAPMNINETYQVTAGIESQENKKLFLHVSIINTHDVTVATTRGIFIQKEMQ